MAALYKVMNMYFANMEGICGRRLQNVMWMSITAASDGAVVALAACSY